MKTTDHIHGHGNYNNYLINKDQLIIMNRDDILRILKEHKDKLREEFAVINIGLYGSYARDEASYKSDIDIYVEFDLDRLTLDKYIRLIEYFEQLFNRRIDIITKEGIRSIRIPYIKDSIERGIIYA